MNKKNTFNETMELVLGCKETKKATDYHQAIILFTKRLTGLPETLF